MMNDVATKINRSWLMLKFTYGLLFVVAGADKFTNLITFWPKYVSPYVVTALSLSSSTICHAVGIGEIILGLILLSSMTYIGAYIAAAWLLIIALNLVTMVVYFDIAVRDIVMAIGAIVLAQLTVVRREFLNK